MYRIYLKIEYDSGLRQRVCRVTNSSDYNQLIKEKYPKNTKIGAIEIREDEKWKLIEKN